jgi:N,N-dimethylformamidase
MRIVGYSDQLSMMPGGTIRFMVSCEEAEKYRVDLVRLIHGDTNPAGPGFKEELIETPLSGEYPGRKQVIYSGSYVTVPDRPLLRFVESFSLQAMIWPTTPGKGVQGVLTRWSASNNAGYGLFIDENGCIALWLGNGTGQTEKVSTGKPLLTRCWYFVGASFDALTGMVHVYQEPIVTATNGRFSVPSPLATAAVERSTQVQLTANNDVPLIMAGYVERVESGRSIIGGLYNGKIDRPRVANRALSRERMAFLIDNPSAEDLVGAWDFAEGIGPKGIASTRIVDKSPNRLHGETVNRPARAMTGYNWMSEEQTFTHAPEQYGAIHFHDDDLDDARWEVDFEFTIPDNMKSALYAMRLRAGEDEDYIPFYVRPRKGMTKARIAFLAPTASYMAYANDHLTTNAPLAQLFIARTPVMQAQDLYLAEHREYGLSTYDTHSDGSGVCYSSRLRPILNMRPKYRHWLSPSLWQFNADLHLIDWLNQMGYEFDIITDQELHFEGVDLLKPYKVVLTGSHPEYYSGPMLDALEAHLHTGGRIMYMGANGFYWIIAYHPENPNVMEVRKWGGSQGWRAQPGEYYLSFTGELGGLWRNRGRAPQKLVGTGFVAEGFDVSSYYRRKPDSSDPRASWIFEGIGQDELIGNFGLVGGGAAGLELDIYDTELGTPPDTLLLASSEGHTDIYLEVVEELFFNVPGLGGTQNPRVRADMVYFMTPNGGAVFSTSSIAWCGSLSHNNYDNNVSRITGQVLKRFMSDEPLPGQKRALVAAGVQERTV